MSNATPAVFYETHAHLDYPDYEADLPEVIDRARAAGIAKIITIGTDLASSRRAIALTERFPAVYAAIGWHPTHALEAPEDVRPGLAELASHPKVVALGETGLDYHHLPSSSGGSTADDQRYKQKQADIFAQHLEIAIQLRLNCVIHQRDAFSDTVAQMEPLSGKVRGVFHCFVGTSAEAARVRSLGSLVSFTGIVTFKNAESVRQTLQSVPAEELMLETDCPYLAPVPYRGKRCEPAYVKEIAETVARVKGSTLEELSRWTCKTAERFFPRLGAV